MLPPNLTLSSANMYQIQSLHNISDGSHLVKPSYVSVIPEYIKIRPDGSPRKLLDSKRLNSPSLTPEFSLKEDLIKVYADLHYSK